MKDMSILLGRVKFESEPNSIWSGSNVVEMPTTNKRVYKHQKIADKDHMHALPYVLRDQQEQDFSRLEVRVLQVSGNIYECRACRKALQQTNDLTMDVIEAANGEDGLRLAEQQDLDLILIDASLPDMTGVEFLGRLTELLSGLLMPVLQLVEPENAFQVAGVSKCGFHDYLIKDSDGTYLNYLSSLILWALERHRVVKEKSQIEAMYTALVEHMPLITYISPLQSDAHLLYVSPQIEVLGFDRDMWLTKSKLRFQCIHEDDRSVIERAFEHSCRSGGKFQCEYRMRSNNGKLHWFLDEAVVVKNYCNQAMFFQGVMRDITDVKIMESELETHRYFLEQRVSTRTEQLEKRIAILESCNTELCTLLEKERMISNELRKNQWSF